MHTVLEEVEYAIGVFVFSWSDSRLVCCTEMLLF